MSSFSIRPLGSSSLSASRAFLEGFTPASGGSASIDESLALAFRLDGTFAPAGVLLRQDKDIVDGDVFGGVEVAVAQKQVARMLGLDVDANAWDHLADPVLAKVRAAYAGFRPVAFPSPWEAGVWGLLAHRINMKQAAGIKRKVAEEHGDVVVVARKSIPVFPSPRQVLEMPSRPVAIPDEKWLRIKSLAQATVEGALDPDELRALAPDMAMARLRKLRGVGPWTAAHIHIRGAATVDVISLDEPRVRRAVQHAYALKTEPNDEQMHILSEGWRPYRTWAMVLLAMHLNRTGAWTTSTKKAVASTVR